MCQPIVNYLLIENNQHEAWQIATQSNIFTVMTVLLPQCTCAAYCAQTIQPSSAAGLSCIPVPTRTPLSRDVTKDSARHDCSAYCSTAGQGAHECCPTALLQKLCGKEIRILGCCDVGMGTTWWREQGAA